MNFKEASRDELIQIAWNEDCSLDLKYQAVAELQSRGFLDMVDQVSLYTDRDRKIIADLYMDGYLLSNIALRFGRTKQGIKDQLRYMHREGLPYRTFMRWTLNGKVPESTKRMQKRAVMGCSQNQLQENRGVSFPDTHILLKRRLNQEKG